MTLESSDAPPTCEWPYGRHDCPRLATVHTDADHWLCDDHAQASAEHAFEAANSRWYGGDGPMPLDEICAAAQRLK